MYDLITPAQAQRESINQSINQSPEILNFGFSLYNDN